MCPQIKGPLVSVKFQSRQRMTKKKKPLKLLTYEVILRSSIHAEVNRWINQSVKINNKNYVNTSFLLVLVVFWYTKIHNEWLKMPCSFLRPFKVKHNVLFVSRKHNVLSPKKVQNIVLIREKNENGGNKKHACDSM